MRLSFPLAETLELVRHALQAPEHRGADAPSLLWFKADGTYLLSSGSPGLLRDPANPDSPPKAVYAHGFGPDTGEDPDLVDGLGGDDFCERVALDDLIAGGLRLCDWLERVHTDGATTLTITLTSSQFAIGCETIARHRYPRTTAPQGTHRPKQARPAPGPRTPAREHRFDQ